MHKSRVSPNISFFLFLFACPNELSRIVLTHSDCLVFGFIFLFLSLGTNESNSFFFIIWRMKSRVQHLGISSQTDDMENFRKLNKHWQSYVGTCYATMYFMEKRSRLCFCHIYWKFHAPLKYQNLRIFSIQSIYLRYKT